MGLIELILVVGILATVGLAVSSLSLSQQRAALSVQKRLDAGQLSGFISSIFTNQVVCAASGLIGKPAPAAKSPSSPDTVSVPTLNYAGMNFDDSGGANSLFDNGQVKIQNLKYHAVSINGSIYSVVVRLQVNARGTSGQTVVGGDLLAPSDLPVVFTVSGGLISSCGSTSGRICNANGCYRIESDGTIEEWGRTNVTGGGGSARLLVATFPFPFTTTAQLEVEMTGTGIPNGDGNPHPLTCFINGVATANNFSAIISLPVQIGGSGYASFSGAEYCSWHAWGH